MLSYLYPITLRVISNTRHPHLKLQLFCNQFMLSTQEAVYSFGTFYTPFRKSFKAIRRDIKQCRSFLLLGTGLGSALLILQKKHHVFPASVLVDNDQDILDLSMEYMQLNSQKNVVWVHSDAGTYMQNNSGTFDLIGVDIFRDTMIPRDFKQTPFFEQCKMKLNPGGHCIFNMILNSSNEHMIIRERLQQHFSSLKELRFKVNTFYICSNPGSAVNK
jgi:predicted membrane-bound spermidine synthase